MQASTQMRRSCISLPLPPPLLLLQLLLMLLVTTQFRVAQAQRKYLFILFKHQRQRA